MEIIEAQLQQIREALQAIEGVANIGYPLKLVEEMETMMGKLEQLCETTDLKGKL